MRKDLEMATYLLCRPDGGVLKVAFEDEPKKVEGLRRIREKNLEIAMRAHSMTREEAKKVTMKIVKVVAILED